MVIGDKQSNTSCYLQWYFQLVTLLLLGKNNVSTILNDMFYVKAEVVVRCDSCICGVQSSVFINLSCIDGSPPSACQRVVLESMHKLLFQCMIWGLFSPKCTFHETHFFGFSIHRYFPNSAPLHDFPKERYIYFF